MDFFKATVQGTVLALQVIGGLRASPKFYVAEAATDAKTPGVAHV